MTTTENTNTTEPAQHCTQCDVGPFFYVEERPYPTLCMDCAELVTPSATTVRTGMVNDEEHAVLDAEWHRAFNALRAAGLESDADHPIAARYRTASDAVNHANRSRDFAIASGQPTDGRPATYRERREAKADRLRGWAEKRETKAADDLERARGMASVIPFGQPILVGHYSEGRDRRYRDRIGRTYDRAFESANKAENMKGRADGIEHQLATSIYDDDPDAVEQLEARIAGLEAKRDSIKAANAAYRKDHRDELKAMSAYQRDQAMPHRGYELTNLTGNIKRNRDRLAVVKRQQERRAASETAGGVLVEERGAYAIVTFAEKPAREILDALKGAGFRWAKGSWVGDLAKVPALTL